MTQITFRPCTPEDLQQAVPLMYSAGPVAFDIVFNDTHTAQSKAFLQAAFLRSGGEFSHDQHLAIIRNDELVGLGGIKTAKHTLPFTLQAALVIFKFYAFTSAIRTIIRGLRMESILRPPKKRIAMIHNLAISSDFQGEGLGTQLIAQLEQKMKKSDYKIAALNVDGDNPRAKALYQKLGYQVVEKRTSLVRGKFTKPMEMRSFYMEKKLD